MLVLATLKQRSASAAYCGLGGSPECWSITTHQLPDEAEAAVERVIDRMYQSAAADAGSQALELEIEKLLLGGLTTAAALGRIFDFLSTRVRYVSDADSLAAGGLVDLVHAEAELLISPADLLSMSSPAGDCDEFATAAIALILAAGLPVTVRLRTVAADPRLPGAWSHVYVVVRTASGDVAFDASHGTALGWEAKPGAITRRGGEVAYTGRRKDWGNAHMEVSTGHVEGLRKNLGAIAGWSETIQAIIPEAAKTGLSIASRRYGNPPAGTYRTQVGADGSSLSESFGVQAFPNNVTSTGPLLIGGVAVVALLIFSSRQSSREPRWAR